MKKWFIITLAAAALLLYAGFMVYWLTGLGVPQEQTIATTPTEAPVAATVETEAPTESAATETQAPPLATIMPENYTLTAAHAFVYDCGAESLLFTLGDQQQSIAPASLTKLLTAYVALQKLPKDTLITVGEEVTWIDPASSIAFIQPGDTLSVELLVEGMLLQSGNDAAYALAVAAGRVIGEDASLAPRSALSVFMDEVNRQAELLGLEDTYFVTPDGLDSDNHHTTAADMLKIALLIMEEPTMRHYAGVPKDTVMFESGASHDWLNTNFLLQPENPYYCPEACGMKTGYTSKAGACMIAAFYTGDRYLLIGIFGCPKYEDRFADAMYLYEMYR